jgi:haloalkane dehalogenase
VAFPPRAQVVLQRRARVAYDSRMTDDVRWFDGIAARLAYRVMGDGPALVLVHGYPVHGETWRKILPELARRFTCYVPDLPGLGLTEWRADTDFTFHGHAANLRRWIDALGLASYDLAAHDTGATVARCLADADQTRVRRLTLINTEMPGHRPPWIPLYRHLAALPGASLNFGMLMRLRWFRRTPMGFGGCFVDRDLIEGDFKTRFVDPLLTSSRRLHGSLRYLRGIGWDVVDGMRAVHARLRMPVQLVWGMDDPTFPAPLARAMAEQFPTPAPFVPIERAALLPHEERPETVLAALLAFHAAAGGERIRSVH